jgi:predicted DNA-binding protein with PD1-like motif
MKNLFSITIRLMLLALVFTGALDVFGQTLSQTKQTESGEARTMRVFALRLKPGQDLRQQIEAFVKEKHLRAGFIITTVGSLRQAAIRLADQSSATQFDGKFEIVSLVGTLGQDGVHLHISISDSNGKTIGGHLVEGCLIYRRDRHRRSPRTRLLT